jgi:hypothetical protein
MSFEVKANFRKNYKLRIEALSPADTFPVQHENITCLVEPIHAEWYMELCLDGTMFLYLLYSFVHIQML